MEPKDRSDNSIALQEPCQNRWGAIANERRTDWRSPSQLPLKFIIAEKPNHRKPNHRTNEFFKSQSPTIFPGFALFEFRQDPTGKPCDFRCVEVNRAFEQMIGPRAGRIAGTELSMALAELEHAWMDLCLRVVQKGKAEQLHRYFPALGKKFEIHVFRPALGHLATLLFDITALEQVKQMLLESEDRFRSIAENADHAILISHTINSSFVYANRFAEKMTGYFGNELLKLRPAHLVGAAEIARIKTCLRHDRREKIAPKRYSVILVRKNGQTLPIEVYGARVTWHGRPGFLTQFRDVSCYKRVEDRLERIIERLHRQMQEKTTLLTHTSGELEMKRKELQYYKKDIERANLELVQTNTALAVLARNIERSHEEFEKKIAGIISSRISPVIEELRQAKIPGKCLAALDVITTYLSDLTPGVAKGHDVIVSLSPTEMRVALMIKKGFSSCQIGRLLNISLDTVKTHRRNIRRKLSLRNSPTNLSAFLQHKIGSHPCMEESSDLNAT